MKQEIAYLLSSIDGLEDFSTDYPQEMATFPCAIYRTAAEGHAIDAYRNEMQTKWTVVIEVYGIKSVSELAANIADGMRRLGFRVSDKDSNTAGLKRVVLECRAIVDNKTKMVFL
nr:hypothetical protein [uncultured Trichococcus sp.]